MFLHRLLFNLILFYDCESESDCESDYYHKCFEQSPLYCVDAPPPTVVASNSPPRVKASPSPSHQGPVIMSLVTVMIITHDVV